MATDPDDIYTAARRTVFVEIEGYFVNPAAVACVRPTPYQSGTNISFLNGRELQLRMLPEEAADRLGMRHFA